MAVKRIVSFLPSATELIYELGAQDMLYGVTHECKYPIAAQKKPQVISSVINSKKLSSGEINSQVCNFLNQGKDIFILNEKILQRANPDLIISQETCEVCAPYINQVNQAMQILNKKSSVFSIDPHNLGEILMTVTKLGQILERETKAKEVKLKLEERISYVKKIPKKQKLKVLALEWIDPFFSAGHWIPEMIELAGGNNVISKKGEHSRKISIEEILNSKPEIIVLMPCGFSAKKTIEEYKKILKNNSVWSNLKAVKNNKVFAVDANSFFSKPSIRTVTGLEILAKIIQAENSSNLNVPKNSYCKI